MLQRIFGKKGVSGNNVGLPLKILAGELFRAGREASGYLPSCAGFNEQSESAWARLQAAKPDAVRDHFGEVTYLLDFGPVFRVTLQSRFMEGSSPHPVEISGTDAFDGIVLVFPFMGSPLTRLEKHATEAAADLQATFISVLGFRDGNREGADLAARFARWKANQE